MVNAIEVPAAPPRFCLFTVAPQCEHRHSRLAALPV